MASLPVYLLLGTLLLLFPFALLTAQEMEHGGYRGRPGVITGIEYRSTNGNEERAAMGSLSFMPHYLHNTFRDRRLEILPGYLLRGYAAGIRAGVAFDSTGAHRTLWRATLLDVDLASVLFHFQWNRVCGDSPLMPLPRPTGLGYLAGLTVLDYDKSGLAELDARWAQARAGVLYTTKEYVSPHIRANLSAGATTFRPGMANYAELGEEADQSLFGFEAGAEASLGLEIGTSPPGRETGRRFLTTITVDGQLRTITADNTIGILSLGGTLRGLFAFPGSCDDTWGSGRGIELLFSIRREFMRIDDAEQKTDILEAGLQYSFDL